MYVDTPDKCQEWLKTVHHALERNKFARGGAERVCRSARSFASGAHQRSSRRLLGGIHIHVPSAVNRTMRNAALRAISPADRPTRARFGAHWTRLCKRIQPSELKPPKSLKTSGEKPNGCKR